MVKQRGHKINKKTWWAIGILILVLLLLVFASFYKIFTGNAILKTLISGSGDPALSPRGTCCAKSCTVEILCSSGDFWDNSQTRTSRSSTCPADFTPSAPSGCWNAGAASCSTSWFDCSPSGNPWSPVGS